MQLRTILELVILAGIERNGWGSLYQIRRDADLSSGAVIPALRKLMRLGLVSAANRADEKQGLSLTEGGREALEAGWRVVFFRMPKDLPSILRAAWLVAVMADAGGEAGRDASRFVHDAIQEQRRLSEEYLGRAGSFEAFTYGSVWNYGLGKQFAANAEILTGLLDKISGIAGRHPQMQTRPENK